MVSLFVLLLVVISPFHALGQSSASFASFTYSADTSLQNGEEYYDEVSITVNVPRIGSVEMLAIIFKDELYLPIKDFFDFLKIRNNVSPDFDLVEGFFIYPTDNYFIDKTNNRAIYKFKSFELTPGDLIRTENNLYMRSDLFGEIFGLDCIFDFRNLSVTLNTKIELPAIREMQQELMRRNVNRLQGEKKADTTIGRSFPLFNIGAADWTVTSSQETKAKPHTRLNLGLGGIIAGGEMNLSLNYFSGKSLDLKQQLYQWRLVNNEHKIVRQVTAGKIFPQSVSSLFAPIIGMQVTNTPSTYRKSFGTFTLSNMTGPGWTVELYVNNVLINYTKADASGFYTFEVPMVYGNTLVKLRFYSQWGEEQMSEKYITVPFNFIPVNQLEYTVAAGVVEDNDKARFTRLNVNYGLARRITIGGGVEYLSSVTSGKSMPFVQASMVLGSHMLVSAEHSYNTRSKASLNYRLPSNLQFDLVYIKYAKGQTAIRVNHIEEKKLVISMPVKGRKFNAFSRLSINEFTFPFNEVTPSKGTSKYTSAEYLFSSTMSGITSNLTTYAVFNNRKNPLVYSNLSLTYRLPKGFRLSHQAQYEYSQSKLSTLKAEVEKSLFSRGFLNLSYQKDFLNDKNSIVTLGLRYNFSFAQTFFSASKTSKSVLTTQSAHGSLLVDGKTNYIGTGNQNNTGKGGIVLLPYLDMNCNGQRDDNEPKVAGLKMHVNGGRVQNNLRDTLIRISGLEAYASYYVEMDKNSFDNIAWQIRKPVVKVIIDPNLYKLIEVPVAVVAEVSGTVFLKKDEALNGLARMIVNIYNSESVFVTKVLTEADGFFSFIGLAPGEYRASVDAGQLKKLNMQSSHDLVFKVLPGINGDIVSDLKFVVAAKEAGKSQNL